MSVVVFAVTALDGTSMCICNCGFAMVYLQWCLWFMLDGTFTYVFVFSV